MEVLFRAYIMISHIFALWMPFSSSGCLTFAIEKLSFQFCGRCAATHSGLSFDPPWAAAATSRTGGFLCIHYELSLKFLLVKFCGKTGQFYSPWAKSTVLKNSVRHFAHDCKILVQHIPQNRLVFQPRAKKEYKESAEISKKFSSCSARRPIIIGIASAALWHGPLRSKEKEKTLWQ